MERVPGPTDTAIYRPTGELTRMRSKWVAFVRTIYGLTLSNTDKKIDAWAFLKEHMA